MKAAEWIDRAKAAQGWESDYRAAKELGLSRATVSKYRSRTPTLDDESAVKVAHALGIPLASIIIDQAAERTKNPEVKAALKEEAARLYIMLSGAGRRLKRLITLRMPPPAMA